MQYAGYGISFDRYGTSSFPTGGFGCNVIIFGVLLMSNEFFCNVDNKKKNILILDEGPIQGLDNTILTINFTLNRKTFCLSLYYNGANSYLFVTGTEIIKFKAKDSKIVATPLCLGNISKYVFEYNMKKTVFYGYV